MAQTVSIQRGSVTFTANGNSTANNTTLFTNTSSGNGTRVIVNYLTLNNPWSSTGDRQYYRGRGFLAVVSPGTTGAIIGTLQNSSTGVMSTQMPIQDPGSAYTASINGYQLVVYGNYGYNINEVGFANQRPMNIGLSVGASNASGFCPRNFWIGPSDVIKWFPQDSYYITTSGKYTYYNYVTQTLYYSFTCITES